MTGTAEPGGGRREEPEDGRLPAEPEGGDPACWLDRVCPACGALQDTARYDHCARCGAVAENS
ncbi:hypothetical protein [Streptomyces sp. NPDC048636]|uniref:hypothetical protein n=1 Tax=Streptomyces sp. NPDC048636 TaxID=3155762 RepID=UPI00343E3EA5